MGELVSNLGGSEGQKLLGALALIVGFGFIFVQSQARWNERGLFARLQEWSRQNRVHVGWALIIFVVGFLTPLVSRDTHRVGDLASTGWRRPSDCKHVRRQQWNWIDAFSGSAEAYANVMCKVGALLARSCAWATIGISDFHF